MAKARAIIKRLKAIKNIRKITRTMELVATARFKKAMERATQAAAYTKKLAEIVADVSASLGAEASTGVSHPLLEARPVVKKSALLVINSNRGLCGGYNSGILRVANQVLRERKESQIPVDVYVCGKRGINFFKFQRQAMAETYTNFEDKPTFAEVDSVATKFVEQFVRGEIDQLDVAFMSFESMARQKPIVVTVLPVSRPTSDQAVAAAKTPVDYEFLPSPTEILADIVPASFKARVFKAFLDAAVSEQVYRMVAMKSATENADGMLRDLKQKYNRARQSQITSELSEIIGGAAALE